MGMFNATLVSILSHLIRRDSPFIGGILSKPHDRWPGVFSNPFWIEYPYFLPCAASALFSVFVFVVTLFFLQEVRRLWRRIMCLAQT